MMYSEFCEMLEDDFACPTTQLPTQEEYELIEFVYMWYPAEISKEDCCLIWRTKQPMLVFADMLPRARKNKSLNISISQLKSRINCLQKEQDALTYDTVRLTPMDKDTQTDEEDEEDEEDDE